MKDQLVFDLLHNRAGEPVYFCEKCGLVVRIYSNPERLYECSCGKTGDYVNCKTIPFAEYVYEMMKRFVDDTGFNDGIDETTSK